MVYYIRRSSGISNHFSCCYNYLLSISQEDFFQKENFDNINSFFPRSWYTKGIVVVFLIIICCFHKNFFIRIIMVYMHIPIQQNNVYVSRDHLFILHNNISSQNS